MQVPNPRMILEMISCKLIQWTTTSTSHKPVQTGVRSTGTTPPSYSVLAGHYRCWQLAASRTFSLLQCHLLTAKAWHKSLRENQPPRQRTKTPWHCNHRHPVMCSMSHSEPISQTHHRLRNRSTEMTSFQARNGENGGRSPPGPKI